MPHNTKLIPTGLKSIIPKNYYVQIQERGSTGSKGIKYSAGVIDSNYRGEWFLAITNTNDVPLVLYDGDLAEDFPSQVLETWNKANAICYPLYKAIFQGVVHKVNEDIDIVEVDSYTILKDKTKRGTGKLGSSGK